MKKHTALIAALGLALPAAAFLPSVAAATLSAPQADRGWIGVSLGGASGPDGEQRIGVVQVMPGSPAERSEMRDGDVILSVDGQSVGSHGELAPVLGRSGPGSKVRIALLRKIEASLGHHEEDDDRPWLGVGLGSNDGAAVTSVQRGSPADRAGLREGDRVVLLGGERLSDANDLIEGIARHEPGERVGLGVVREVDLVLGSRPDEQAAPQRTRETAPQQPRRERLGDDERGYLGIDMSENENGRPMVSGVYEGSPADRVGLQPGDVILRVDGERMGSTSDLSATLSRRRPGERVEVTVAEAGSGGERSTMSVELGRRDRLFGGEARTGSGQHDDSHEMQEWRQELHERMEEWRHEWHGSMRDLHESWQDIAHDAREHAEHWADQHPEWVEEMRSHWEEVGRQTRHQAEQWRREHPEWDERIRAWGMQTEMPRASNELRDELRTLREELRELRGEVAELRRALRGAR